MKEQARFMHLRSYMTLRPTLRHRGARRRFRRRMRGRWDRCRRRVSRQAGVIHGDKGGVQGCGVLRGAERFVALAWHWARYMTETVGHVLPIGRDEVLLRLVDVSLRSQASLRGPTGGSRSAPSSRRRVQ